MLLSCRSSFHILNIDPFSNTCSANIFSHSLGYLFTLLYPQMCGSFLVWCILTSIFFSFVAYAFHLISKKVLPRPMSWRFSPKFSPRSFIVLSLCLTFQSILSWFFYMVHDKVHCYSFTCGYPVSFVDCPFPIVYSWHPAWRSVDHICDGLFLDNLVYFTGL